MGSNKRTHSITALLTHWHQGETEALDQLEPLVRQPLNLIAKRMLGSEWIRPTLEPTELVHETWIKLLEARVQILASRRHFYHLAARMMRHFLINRANKRKALKNHDRWGRPIALVVPDNLDHLQGREAGGWTALEQALAQLRQVDPRKERVTRLYCYGGFKRTEIAEFEGVSVSTIKRELRFSLAWLRSQLGGA